jgi:hypothetical protein
MVIEFEHFIILSPQVGDKFCVYRKISLADVTYASLREGGGERSEPEGACATKIFQCTGAPPYAVPAFSLLPEEGLISPIVMLLKRNCFSFFARTN